MTPGPETTPPLSPWPVRLLVYLALVAAALVAIRIIDARAMKVQHDADEIKGVAAPAAEHHGPATHP